MLVCHCQSLSRSGESASQSLILIELPRKSSGGVKCPLSKKAANRPCPGRYGSGRLVLASGPEVISESDAVVLVLATPIDSHMSPCFRAIDDVLQSYRLYLRDGQLLILEKAPYIRVPRHASTDGFPTTASRFDLAVCPERLAQGRGLAELFALPQIISAFSKKVLKDAHALLGAQ